RACRRDLRPDREGGQFLLPTPEGEIEVRNLQPAVLHLFARRDANEEEPIAARHIDLPERVVALREATLHRHVRRGAVAKRDRAVLTRQPVEARRAGVGPPPSLVEREPRAGDWPIAVVEHANAADAGEIEEVRAAVAAPPPALPVEPVDAVLAERHVT